MITDNAKQTQELGRLLSRELRGGEVICLEGGLGAGKTTFAQGLLRGLGAKGHYTSPTFLIVKHYLLEKIKDKKQKTNKSQNLKPQITDIYHVDAYRVESADLLALGWKEIIAGKKNVTIVEWPDRVKKILPKKCLKISFQWLDKNRRQISFSRPLPRYRPYAKNNNA